MALIYVTDKEEVRQLTCKSDGVDFMDDILGNNDVQRFEGEIDAWWQMDEKSFQWWAEWAYREERILEKANELGEDAIEAIAQIATEHSDMDAIHDAQEKYLGIGA